MNGNSSYQGLPILNNPVLYIAADLKIFGRYKIGITTQQDANHRLQQGRTSNPEYFYLNMYNLASAQVSQKELYDFERFVHKKLADFGIPVTFFQTGRDSEWFEMDIHELVSWIEHWILSGFAFPFVACHFDDEVLNRPTDAFYQDVALFYRPCPFNAPECTHPYWLCYLVDYHLEHRSVGPFYYRSLLGLKHELKPYYMPLSFER